jgi:hypothetical protein
MYTQPKPELEHVALYDPVKAHEYYLRTRKLKGRKKGKAEPTGVTRAVGAALATRSARRPATNNPQLHRQRQQAAARVSTLRKKLAELNARLKEKEAEKRETEREAKKGPDAADKRKAAKRSKEWRAENQQKVKQQEARRAAKEKSQPAKKSGGGEDSIEGIKKAITRVKGALEKAVARQRALG